MSRNVLLYHVHQGETKHGQSANGDSLTQALREVPPMGLGIPPLKIKILLEPKPLKFSSLVGRSAVQVRNTKTHKIPN